MGPDLRHAHIGVIIPAYRVSDHILDVIGRIGEEVARIIVVDDACPEGSGKLVEKNCRDPRVEVIFHPENRGVGGAVVTGYRRAVELGLTIAVKVDGDGQMAPELIPTLVMPILIGEADYAKGNRFFNPEDVLAMPAIRLIGNAGLSFMTKLSSGYWSIFDPTNGFTAIHTSVLPILRIDRLAPRYFFESDMLFRLNLLRCKVTDVPMTAVYREERSNLRVGSVAAPFLWSNMRNTFKRVAYNYFIRNFSIASLYLLVGTALMLFGVIFGATAWIQSIDTAVPRSTGTVMLAVLPILIGLQLLLGFVGFDLNAEPGAPIHPRLLRLGSHGVAALAPPRAVADIAEGAR